MKASYPSREAFSLTELLITMGVIAVLATLVLAGVGQYRERSEGYRCMANLRQIGAATAQYAGEHRNELPFMYYVNSNGSTGSGAYTGTWYYNLAPYLGVPRTEISGSYPSTERTNLGTVNSRIGAPIVFTCPSHKKTETNVWWTPHPMSFPAEKPVSYAPPLNARGALSPRGLMGPSIHWTGIEYYPLRTTDIEHPSRKVWISDSGSPDLLNTTSSRWQDSSTYAANYPHQGFTRHNNGGNALFFDGHVEWLPLKTFTAHPTRTVQQRERLYFNAFRAPEIDE